MKKIFTIILMLFLIACSSNNTNNNESIENEIPVVNEDNEVSKTETPTTNIESNVDNQNIIDFTSKQKMSYSCNNIDEQFNLLNIKYPTVIDTFIGEDNNYLGFIYLTECSDEEYEYIKDAIHRNEDGTAYLYYGYMNKIKDNLYAVDGDYLFPTWNEYENIVTKDIDFYVYIEDGKLYFIFDYIEDLDKYQDYIDFNHYAIYQKSWN
ncbi:MAG: hypothetical protein ACI4PE_04020 [Bacilli bacterium]